PPGSKQRNDRAEIRQASFLTKTVKQMEVQALAEGRSAKGRETGLGLAIHRLLSVAAELHDSDKAEEYKVELDAPGSKTATRPNPRKDASASARTALDTVRKLSVAVTSELGSAAAPRDTPVSVRDGTVAGSEGFPARELRTDANGRVTCQVPRSPKGPDPRVHVW